MIILNYGCPRTGTTFINRMLGKGVDLIAGKIAEGHSYHPIKSKCGLLNLCYTFQSCDLLFVRTVRDPINIFESFYHAKKMKIEGLDGQNDESIKRIIELEETNTRIQSEGLRLVTIDFDKMGDIDYSKEKILEICSHTKDPARNSEIYLNFIRERYNKLPIRQGRLSDNSREISYLTQEQKQTISSWHKSL